MDVTGREKRGAVRFTPAGARTTTTTTTTTRRQQRQQQETSMATWENEKREG
jgi:hypothetical protein